MTWTVAEGRRGPALARGRGARRRTSSTRSCSRPTRTAGSATSSWPAADGLWTLPSRGRRDAPRQPRRPRRRASGTSSGWPFAPDDALLVEGSPISRGRDRLARTRSWSRRVASPVAGVVIGARRDAAPSGRRSGSSACRRRAGGSARGARSRSTTTALPVLDGGERLAARARLTPSSWTGCGQGPATARSSRETRG